MPGAVAQGLIWGVMAIGLYITYKVLDYADLTVDGTMATGGAVCIMLMMQGVNTWVALLCAVLAGMLAGMVTGLLHTCMGIPAILAGILTQLSLYSINLTVMAGKANQAVSATKYDLIVSSRYVKELSLRNPIFITILALAALIGVLYWFFGTEIGCSLPGLQRRSEPISGLRTCRCSKVWKLMRMMRKHSRNLWILNIKINCVWPNILKSIIIST